MDAKGKVDASKFDREFAENAGDIFSDYLKDKVKDWGSSMSEELVKGL